MRRKEEKKMTLAEREERIMRAEECVRAHGDREALALFRIMRETSIRMNDLLDLAPENMNGRELLVVESKYREKGRYRNADGSCPVISEETWAMLVPGEDGKYFHHSREYYVGLFRKVIEDKECRYHELRRFVFDKSKMRIG